MHEVKVQIKALPGAEVSALNYRCRPPCWERGTVTRVDAQIQGPGKVHVSYDVKLTEDSAAGRARWLYVGNHGLEVDPEA